VPRFFMTSCEGIHNLGDITVRERREVMVVFKSISDKMEMRITIGVGLDEKREGQEFLGDPEGQLCRRSVGTTGLQDSSHATELHHTKYAAVIPGCHISPIFWDFLLVNSHILSSNSPILRKISVESNPAINRSYGLLRGGDVLCLLLWYCT
jgi:hypothetical protein